MEPIEPLGLATKAIEMLTVVGLLVLVQRLRSATPGEPGRRLLPGP